MNKKVKILSSPVTERYVRSGDIGNIDTQNNQIQVKGHWFSFDERWIVEPFNPSVKGVK